jgi:hypothetical protein
MSSEIARESCPSELGLDRFQLGESPAAERAHVEACADCRARLEARAAAFAALPDRAGMIRDLHVAAVARGEARRAARRGALLPRWLGGLLAAAAASVLVVVVATRPDVDADGVRPKGDAPALSVLAERGDHTERLSSGARLAPGQRLRFQLSLPAPAWVLVVGVEASGRLYAVHPTSTDPSTAAVRFEAGSGQVLPGAVRLDDSIGRESLHAVACPERFELGALAGSVGRITAPEGCRVADFELEKGTP